MMNSALTFSASTSQPLENKQISVNNIAQNAPVLWQRGLLRFRRLLRSARRTPSWQLGLVLGCLGCADGAYLQAKAWLAQELIAQAWQQQLVQGGAVKPWPWADTWPVARLQAPAQGVDLYVLDGSHGSALAFGPGRLNGTADPGTSGLSIVGGHRDTHFSFLQQLHAGDLLQLTNAQGEQVGYQVEQSWVADIRSEDLSASADEDRLLLVTCYPFDALVPGGPLRYVVSARPMSVSGNQA